jgi:hypothetical protein
MDGGSWADAGSLVDGASSVGEDLSVDADSLAAVAGDTAKFQTFSFG